MTASVKGSLAKRSRAKPFNDWAVPAYITAVTAEVSLALSPKSFDFQKSDTFKGLNSSPRMYTDVSFNPENGAFSKNGKVTHRQTD